MKLFNTRTQSLDTFIPLKEGTLSMYVCGITPYDTTHVGHAFTYITFDVLQKYLAYKGYRINYVQNVTDIDDDILKRAKKLNENWKTLGEFWTKRFLTDIQALNMDMPTNYVKATETIPTMITIIEDLIAKDAAYENEGNVYFNVTNDSKYGKLSRFSEEEMIALSKERGADPLDPKKKHPLDFILWQKSLPDEPFWESPWGKGRPGWHIECSAMIYKYIDKNIDIHGGGSDLIYPHHESEIAQSETFTTVKPFVNIWMHTGAVGYQGEKMSKSLGNLVLVSDLLKKYDPNAIRYLLLSHHYREPWEFTEEELKQAANTVKQIQHTLTKKELEQTKTDDTTTITSFEKLLEDDLNTPKALTLLKQSLTTVPHTTLQTLYRVLGFSF